MSHSIQLHIQPSYPTEHPALARAEPSSAYWKALAPAWGLAKRTPAALSAGLAAGAILGADALLGDVSQEHKLSTWALVWALLVVLLAVLAQLSLRATSSVRPAFDAWLERRAQAQRESSTAEAAASDPRFMADLLMAKSHAEGGY